MGVFMLADSTPVARALSLMNIPYRLFCHAGPIESLEQAARERGQQPEQVVRSILFRLEKDKYIMVLAAGPAQISWPALRRYLGQSRLTMAKPVDVLAVTGYAIGTVSPFGLPAPLRIMMDESVLAQDELSMGSGEKGVGIIMRREDLMRALGEVEIGRFT
jgi:Cys-tRNA(Pro) deacylase